jgi:hypothetical protein
MTEMYSAQRDVPPRVLRVLAVVRRHLEPDPRREREEDADSGGAGGDRGRVVVARGRALKALTVDVDPVARRLQRGEVREATDERDLEHTVRRHHREPARHPESRFRPWLMKL